MESFKCNGFVFETEEFLFWCSINPCIVIALSKLSYFKVDGCGWFSFPVINDGFL
jgi:hypothetical protein